MESRTYTVGETVEIQGHRLEVVQANDQVRIVRLRDNQNNKYILKDESLLLVAKDPEIDE